MKKLVVFFAALFVMVIAVQNVNAQVNPTASDEAVASATIIAELGIAKVDDLLFGNIIADADGGTVTVYADGTATSYDGVNAPTAFVGTVQPATFTVTGAIGATYNISLPADGVVLTDPVSTETMTLSAFTSTPTTPSTLADLTETLTVGATLNVGGGQEPGTYTGTFDVTVQYN
ncbi:MAG: DUF4402 domain-containing protein [Bacteroidales bacterium]